MDETSKKPEPDSRSYSEKIRELIEKDYVGGARNLLAVALADRNRGEDLSGLQRVLAPQKFLRLTRESWVLTARLTTNGSKSIWINTGASGSPYLGESY